MRIKQVIVFLALLAVLLPCCSKFDRSKIRMPKFDFVTTENVHSIAYLDREHIWISGNYGTICFSSDGGQTWEKQQSGIDRLLLGSIKFATPTEGWAAGVAGTIIHTADGGKTWQPQQSGTDSDLLDLFMFDAQQGWAVGEMGTVIHTADGGKTWVSQLEPQDAIYSNVFFINPQQGWIVGEFGTILHTADGGATWQPQECKDIEPNEEAANWGVQKPALYGIYFADAQQGWIVGMDGVILKTDDGGQSWKKTVSGTDKPVYSLMVRGSQGWAVGNKGVYLTSSDGGTTWAEQNDVLKTKFWLRNVAFGDDRNGLVVGARGTIAKTDDSGKTWKIISGFRYDMEEFGLADF